MEPTALEFLKSVLKTPSPSGYESPLQQIVRRYAGEFADQVKTDVHGNVIAVKNPGLPLRVMLAGHCDQIALIVRHIDDEGFLYIQPIGGWDPQMLIGQRMTVWAADGPVSGVIGKKPIHLMNEEERKAASEIKKLWIDIGAKNRERALELVAIGDPMTYNEQFAPLDGNLAVARGFDDKIGVFVVGNTLRLLAGAPLSAAVYAVSTVQEEIGLRGATTAAYGIDPHVGIAVDVTFATDHPGAEKKESGDVKVGAGPVITRGPNFNHKVFDLLVATAKEASLPYQIAAANRGTGTDANVIQLTRSGVATGLVSIPNRYMHTPAELVSLEDAENASRLLAAFVKKLTGSEDWTLA